MKITITEEDKKLARWASAAVALSLIDSAIPTPLPGVKPGVANIVTLIVFWHYGFRAMLWVIFWRPDFFYPLQADCFLFALWVFFKICRAVGLVR